jgi:hypothetical protein
MPKVRSKHDLKNFEAHAGDKLRIRRYVDDGTGWDKDF